MKPRARWLVIILTVVVIGGLAAAAVAFGGGDGGNNSSTGSGANGTSGASSSPSPNATATCTMDTHFAYGQVICITDSGVRPAWLVAVVGQPITWQNETSMPQSVRFMAFNIASGPIPPGGTWSYTPRLPLSFAYHVSSGTRLGRIQALAPES